MTPKRAQLAHPSFGILFLFQNDNREKLVHYLPYLEDCIKHIPGQCRGPIGLIFPGLEFRL